MRAISWRLLSKYLPPSGERRNAVLESKRQSYQDLRQNYFKVDSQDETQQDTYRQVGIKRKSYKYPSTYRNFNEI